MKRTRLHRTAMKRGKPIPKVGVRGKRITKEGTLHGSLCEYVKTLPCLICGRRPVDPHHVRSKGAGWLDRLPDGSGNVVPLCAGLDGHHVEGHQVGWRTFGAKYGVSLASIAKEIAARRMGEPKRDV